MVFEDIFIIPRKPMLKWWLTEKRGKTMSDKAWNKKSAKFLVVASCYFTWWFQVPFMIFHDEIEYYSLGENRIILWLSESSKDIFSFDLSLFIFSDAFFDLTQMISGIGTLLAFLRNYSHQATKPKNIRKFKKLLKSKTIKRTKDISGQLPKNISSIPKL